MLNLLLIPQGPPTPLVMEDVPEGTLVMWKQRMEMGVFQVASYEGTVLRRTHDGLLALGVLYLIHLETGSGWGVRPCDLVLVPPCKHKIPTLQCKPLQ